MYAVGLTSLGFETIVIAGDADAYPRIWTMHPDVIVMEVALPETDGWRLLHLLKQDARTRDIPVVVLTAATRPLVRTRAEQEHCAGFVLKPCLPEHLAGTLRRVIVDASADRSPAAMRGGS
jgi:two-component system cell cycle response regulator DivK